MSEYWKTAAFLATAGLLLFMGKKALSWASKDIPANARRVACLGDSLTASGIYCNALKQYLPSGSVTKAWGYTGKGTGYIYNRLDEVLDWAPTDLVVLAGVNDLPKSGGAGTAIANLDKIYSDADFVGVRVVGVHVTPWLGHVNANEVGTQQVNEWIDHAGVKVVNTSELGDSDYHLLGKYGGSDGLHLNRSGQNKLAELIASQAFRWK